MPMAEIECSLLDVGYCLSQLRDESLAGVLEKYFAFKL
tara:strand:- start:558 stop:671 length:114 start_codon:yes stop_codon:yes gene_type:complete